MLNRLFGRVDEESARSAAEADKRHSRPLYSGEIERFYQSEARPVSFAIGNESFLVLKVLALSLFIVHSVGVSLYMMNAGGVNNPPTTGFGIPIPTPPPAAATKITGFFGFLARLETYIGKYLDDSQLIVAFLLNGWFLGYNIISAVIYWQFETVEPVIPDDYEVIALGKSIRKVSSFTAADGNNNSGNDSNGGGLLDLNYPGSTTLRPSFPGNNNAIMHESPNNATDTENEMDLPTLSSTTPLMMHQTGSIFEERPPAASKNGDGAVDRSVVVVTMPDGDFGVGKKQKKPSALDKI